MRFSWLKGKFAFKSVYIIPLSIFAGKVLEIILKIYGISFASPPNVYGNWFVANFIQWFGVLYGILLPLILLRVWEQLDLINREFIREADAVRFIYKSTFFLQSPDGALRRNIAKLIHTYAEHVTRNYSEENEYSDVGNVGDHILQDIWDQCQKLIHFDSSVSRQSEYIALELLRKVDDVIDIRGNRIALASKRLFTSLRIIALITTILFVVPFYFVGFYAPSGILDNLLIIGVTLLVIFIYMVIEDMDEPFAGTWRINDVSWLRLCEEMDLNEYKQELEHNVKSLDKKVRSKKTVNRR